MRILTITWTAIVCFIAGVCSVALALRHGLYDSLAVQILRDAGQMQIWTLSADLSGSCFPTRTSALLLHCMSGAGAGGAFVHVVLVFSVLLGLIGSAAAARSFGLRSFGLCIVPAVYSTLAVNGQLAVAEFAIWPWLLVASRAGGRQWLWAALAAAVWSSSSVHWYLPAAVVLAFSARALWTRRALVFLSALAAGLCVQAALFVPLLPFSLRGLAPAARRVVAEHYGLLPPDFHASAALAALFVFSLAAVLWRPKFISPDAVRGLAAGSVLCLFAVVFQPLLALFTGVALASAFENDADSDLAVQWFPALMIVIGMLLGWERSVSRFETFAASPQPLLFKELQAPSELRLINEPDSAIRAGMRGLPVFIDERVGLFILPRAESVTGTVLGDYLELYGAGPRWEEVVEYWKLNAALVGADSTLYTLLTELRGWRSSSSAGARAAKASAN